MPTNLFRHYIYPVATLAGSIIGVGFLSLPYITLKVGIWPMLFYFAVLTGVILYINLIFVQICLKTPDHKRFPGFVDFYLGPIRKIITLVSTILGSMGVLLVYLFVGGSFLVAVAGPLFGGTIFIYTMLYFLLAAAVVYIGPKANTALDFWALGLLLAILALIAVKGFAHINVKNIFFSGPATLPDWKTLFLPYGAIIFSLWGTGLIPEVEEGLRGNKKLLKKVVIIATLGLAAVYLLFILLILSITGAQTTDSALLGLANFLPKSVFVVAMCIGIITTFTAFISQGIFLKEVLMYDMEFSHTLAWVFTCFTPLVLFLAGFNSFIGLISLIGGVLLGINGIFILQIYKKISGTKKIIYPLIIFFVLGILYEMVFFIG